MIAPWPVYREEMNYPAEEQQLENFKAIVRGIRNVRAEMNVPAGTRTDLFIVGSDEKATEEISVLLDSLGGAKRMLFAKEVFVQSDRAGIAEDAVSVVTGNATAYIPLEELVDKEKEIARLTAESEKMDKEIKRASGMLNNPNFVSKAPAAKVQAEKDKLAKYEEMKKRIAEQLAKYMN
jgi:valyl-tRNA synthetase